MSKDTPENGRENAVRPFAILARILFVSSPHYGIIFSIRNDSGEARTKAGKPSLARLPATTRRKKP